MEEHKSEIADWDLGAGIYIDLFLIKSSLQDDDAMYDMVRNPISHFISVDAAEVRVKLFFNKSHASESSI